MALDLSSPNSPLFKRWGKEFHALKTLDTARETTVPTEINDAFSEYNGTSLALRNAIVGLPPATATWESAGDTLAGAIQNSVQQTVIVMVKEDSQQETDTLTDAIDELVRQMVAASATVEKNVVSATGPTAVGSPTGTGTIICVTKYGNGRDAEFAYNETLSLECTNDSTAPAFTVRGQASAGKLTDKWPLGSGVTALVRIHDPDSDSNQITNGSFETTDDQDLTAPHAWIRGDSFPSTGASAATLTTIQKQTVFVSGTLDSTVYFILTDTDNGTATQPISATASEATMQTELRRLPGWASATVASSGSAPLVKHVITKTGVNGVSALTVSFSGVTGVNEQQTVSITGTPTTGTFDLVCTKNDGTTTNVTVQWDSSSAALDTLLEGVYGTGNIGVSGGPLPGTPIVVTWQGTAANRNVETMTTANNTLDAGAAPAVAATTAGVGIAVAISTASETQAFHQARSYKVLGDGSTDGAILLQAVDLKPETVYGVFVTVKLSASSPSSGVLDIGLSNNVAIVDVNDDNGGSNVTVIDLTAINNTNWNKYSGSIRTPKKLPKALYLYLEMNTAYQNGRTLYIDNIVLVEATELYVMGPAVAAFQGAARWKLGDKYTFAVSNNYAGEIHTAAWRTCSLDTLEKLLPSAASASETLADATFIV